MTGKSRKNRSPRPKIAITPRTPGQEEYIDAIENSDIVVCHGPAGSGKSLLAVGMALKYYYECRDKYQKIVMVRPAVPACDEDLGSLPGDLDEKMAPFIAPMIDSMRYYIDEAEIYRLTKREAIEIIPIAYMRGRSLVRSIIIFDEAQNASPEQMKMFLTRIGFSCKAIIEGDIYQSDIKRRSAINGLSDAIERLQGLDGIGIVKLENRDIVRSSLISKILERYK